MADLALRAHLEGAIVWAALALPEAVQRRLVGSPVEVDGQRLLPEAQLLIQLGKLSPRRPYSELPVPEARKVLEGEARAARGRLIRMAEVREVDAGGLPARLYVPEADRGGLLVYFHGGGWVLGSLESHEQPCRFLAREARVRVLSVDYRLAPEAKFPAAVDDALAAFEWAREHAGELGADPERVAVAGDSAGGNLSAVVAQLASPKPAAVLLIYPATDFSTKRESYRLFRDGYLLTEASIDWFREHYLPDEQAAQDPRASPLLAESFSGLPRTYIAVAGFDPLRDEGLAYGERLKDAGVDVQVAVHEGAVHGFANMVGVGRAAATAMREAAATLKTL